MNIVRIDAEELETKGGTAPLRRLDGILVPGGFGERGIEGKIAAARYAREHGVPYYGLCLGLQIAVIEFARHVLGLRGANSTEFDPQTPHPVINMMEEQKKIIDKGATMRLGSYECALTPGTRAQRAYRAGSVRERHRHRYEVNNAYVDRLQRAGLVVSGLNPRRNLVEIIELKNHPWFVAVQFHPEFQSKPSPAHPLFAAFMAAAIKRRHAQPGGRRESRQAERMMTTESSGPRSARSAPCFLIRNNSSSSPGRARWKTSASAAPWPKSCSRSPASSRS